MGFSHHDLPGRAQELYEAQQAALEDHGDDCDMYDVEASRITGIYDAFSDLPDPDSFGAYTDGLLTAMSKLATGGYETGQTEGGQTTGVASDTLSLVAVAGDEVDDWTGQGADEFHTWSEGWTTGISNQFAATVALRIALNAEAAVWTGVLKDLDNLSKGAVEAMKAVTECNGDDVKLGLSIATAVVGIAAAVPTAGASLSLVAVAGAGLGVASTGMEIYEAASEEPAEISSCCPRCCVEDVEEALGKIKTKITEGEELVIESLQNNIDVINGSWSEFCHPAPSLGGVPRSGIHAYEGMGTYPG
ncbi:hypothetical protein FXB39_04700 [Nocardioides sp. BGMRC 2183]|nr:hypothetical protein FXB39_04700 [Nocardioides sp. BGMRC 2183]